MDETEQEAIRAEGLDPDDPAVVTAIDLVRWQLAIHGGDLDDAGDEVHDLPESVFHRCGCRDSNAPFCRVSLLRRRGFRRNPRVSGGA